MPVRVDEADKESGVSVAVNVVDSPPTMEGVNVTVTVQLEPAVSVAGKELQGEVAV